MVLKFEGLSSITRESPLTFPKHPKRTINPIHRVLCFNIIFLSCFFFLSSNIKIVKIKKNWTQINTFLKSTFQFFQKNVLLFIHSLMTCHWFFNSFVSMIPIKQSFRIFLLLFWLNVFNFKWIIKVWNNQITLTRNWFQFFPSLFLFEFKKILEGIWPRKFKKYIYIIMRNNSLWKEEYQMNNYFENWFSYNQQASIESNLKHKKFKDLCFWKEKKKNGERDAGRKKINSHPKFFFLKIFFLILINFRIY